jgi:hypothetical protein
MSAHDDHDDVDRIVRHFREKSHADSLSNKQFPDGGNMQQLGSLAQKYALASRNFLTWGKPVAARVWISVAFLFR